MEFLQVTNEPNNTFKNAQCYSTLTNSSLQTKNIRQRSPGLPLNFVMHRLQPFHTVPITITSANIIHRKNLQYLRPGPGGTCDFVNNLLALLLPLLCAGSNSARSVGELSARRSDSGSPGAPSRIGPSIAAADIKYQINPTIDQVIGRRGEWV